MKNIYHFHLTISDIDSEQLMIISKIFKCKPTTIDLYNDVKEQRDRMVTKYGTNYEELLAEAQAISYKLSLQGIKVNRIKVEQVFKELPEEVIGQYLEVHVKVEDTEELDKYKHELFSLSKNPSEEGTRFFNSRIYNKVDRELLSYLLNVLQSNLNVFEIQYESVLFDSNHESDKWWG